MASCNLFKESAETQYDQSWEFDNTPQTQKKTENTEIAKNTKPLKKKNKKEKPSKIKNTPPEKVIAEPKPIPSESKLNSSKKYADKWKVNLPASGNVQLLQAIDSWIGTPYKYGGRTKSGTDCSGFCLNIYNEVYKIDIERSTHEILNQSKIVKKVDLEEGDFVFFKINSSRVNHVGIYLGNNLFAHASSSKGVMISNLTENYWTKYWHVGGRILNKNRTASSN